MKTKQKIIHTSKDYEKFTKDTSNRVTGNNPLLKSSMREHGWLPEYPAFVVPDGDRFRILDGQHRFVYAKELGLPVCYVVGERNGLSVSEINNTQRRWSLRDYITSFASQGKKDYQRLIDFSSETGLSLTACSVLLSGRSRCSQAGNPVKLGKFKIQDEEHARHVVSVIQAASKFVPWSKNTLFVTAVSLVLLHTKANHDVLCDKIRAHSARLILAPTCEMFVDMLENIYNCYSRDLVSISMAVKQAIREIAQSDGAKPGDDNAKPKSK